MLAILKKEKGLAVEGLLDDGNLLSTLVLTSQHMKDYQPTATSHMASPTQSRGLSRSDVLGDVDGSSLAGHETTGVAPAFAV